MDKFLVPIDLAQSDTVQNPPAGFTRIQAKTNGDVHAISPAGVVTNLSSVVSVQTATLTATQANTAVTPVVLNGHVFTIPPGKTALIQGTLAATAAATATGIAYGIRVAQGAGASGPAQGSWFITVALTSAAANSALEDGDVINVAAGATSDTANVLGTASTAGNNPAQATAIIRNTSTNANTTVSLFFRSEVAGSAVTAQIGTGATCIIG